MSDRGLIGVVTVTYNSSSVICDFMESLLQQSCTDFILYIVDNASSDETLMKVSEYRDPRITVIANQTNVGVAEGNNIGIRAGLAAGCSSVLLINNDTVFESDLLYKLQDALGQYKCGMVAPKILFYDEPLKIWSAGGYFSRLRGSVRHFGYGQEDNGKYDHPCPVDYSPICCLLIRKEVFDSVGLMDPNYFIYFDDTDFCYIAYRAAIKLYYVPSARLLHKVSSLVGKESDFAVRYNIRNHVYYFLKHFPRWQLLFYLPAFQLHVFITFVIFWRSLRAFVIAESAFIEGISHFYAHAPNASTNLEPGPV